MATQPVNEPLLGVNEDAWREVIAAMDRTYSELVDYQSLLEQRNQELDDMRLFMASVLASVSDLLLVVDSARAIEETGGAIAAVLGTGHAPEIGSPLADLLGSEAQAGLFAVMDQVMLDQRPRMVEVAFDTPDGPTPLEVSVSPRRDKRGRNKGVVLVGRPVGELRAAYRELEASHRALQLAQAQLVQHEKLASLGRLVAGVAHELNNPISFVYANTHSLEKYAERFETYFEAVQSGASRPDLVALREELRLDKTIRNLRTATEGAKDGAERVRDIVADLRRLSADGSNEESASEIVAFDLVTTARTAADWVVRGTRAPIEIAFDGAPHALALGNPGHIQQIVMNLVQNAVDALAEVESGHITLTILNRDSDVVLQVRDTGPGISEAARSSIFDPFFTTKAVGKGTGLGLSISHKIATENNGSLTLVSTGPEGSCFELCLPAGDTP